MAFAHPNATSSLGDRLCPSCTGLAGFLGSEPSGREAPLFRARNHFRRVVAEKAPRGQYLLKTSRGAPQEAPCPSFSGRGSARTSPPRKIRCASRSTAWAQSLRLLESVVALRHPSPHGSKQVFWGQDGPKIAHSALGLRRACLPLSARGAPRRGRTKRTGFETSHQPRAQLHDQ